jgi:hypothetical protein
LIEFSELPLFGVLGSSAYRRAEDRAMLLLRNTSSHPCLLLATAVDIVLLTSKVLIPPFTAIELVPLLPVPGSDKPIVAIAPVEDILPTVEYVSGLVTVVPKISVAAHQVVAWATVDDAFADSSEDGV